MNSDKLQNALEIQMALGNVALKSTINLLNNKMIEQETTPFTLYDSSHFLITIKRLDN